MKDRAANDRSTLALAPSRMGLSCARPASMRVSRCAQKPGPDGKTIDGLRTRFVDYAPFWVPE